MHKKLNLSVYSSLVIGLFLTGCSHQQTTGASQQTAGAQQAYGSPTANKVAQAADMQTTPMAKPMMPNAYDHQVQNTVPPQKPDVHHHAVKPKQVRHYMQKPVQKMAKPIQRQY